MSGIDQTKVLGDPRATGRARRGAAVVGSRSPRSRPSAPRQHQKRRADAPDAHFAPSAPRYVRRELDEDVADRGRDGASASCDRVLRARGPQPLRVARRRSATPTRRRSATRTSSCRSCSIPDAHFGKQLGSFKSKMEDGVQAPDRGVRGARQGQEARRVRRIPGDDRAHAARATDARVDRVHEIEDECAASAQQAQAK